ncbi:helix-turn-helix domain-containing protein [Phycicoccus endophyticus]|uniref:Helix-turn-helix domain-containing protein n=1 Tax=Phycicoccus endophyticus TaxID=1690220 RepID=A0A7G9QY90_9MICO|nr:helix-turn-helix transcriptional regulator [Phycicoccus endophyticus]NHI19205.1 helix-turn-helix domain-containing protein [Phycicoccus endophyticus]QNN48315.1 helix-turn-helix domain-containing protein [Phycicoccus endophyticus]GGL40945.1 DNA-binding protein [Phycicoccus endophyticus]
MTGHHGDRAQLADFLRTRREALQPEDVGLPRGPRRRTGGLRREEVAALAGMSADYLGRIEQQRGPHPSAPMLAALARGLRLSLDERDHLFRLGGLPPPSRAGRHPHVDAGIMRILDRLQDTPAMVLGPAAECLAITPPAAAVFGDRSALEGLARSSVYRWFTDPVSREVYPAEDHDRREAEMVADLRSSYARHGDGSSVGEVVAALTRESPRFRRVWARHDVRHKHSQRKRLVHEVGELDVYCTTLFDAEQSQSLLVFTAATAQTAQRLRLLGVVGGTTLPAAP